MRENVFEVLGASLKQQREQRGLELSDLAESTKISLHQLEALEAGDESRLPAPVFIKGFLRTYALEVGLDPVEVLREFNSLTAGRVETVSVPVTARKEPGWGTWPWVAAIITVFIVLMACVGVYYFFYWQQPQAPAEPVAVLTEGVEGPAAPVPGGDDAGLTPAASETPQEAAPDVAAGESQTPRETPADAPDAAVDTPAEQPAVEEPSATLPEPAAEPTPPAAPAAVQAEGHELKIVFTAETWVQVLIDGKTLQHGLYRSGMTETWTAKEGFDVRLGNAGGAEVFLDGQSQGVPGQEGRVIDMKLP